MDTARRRRTVLSVELHNLSTSTVVLLTFSPAVARWIRRVVLALLASGSIATVGRFMWTYVQGH